MKKSGSKLRKTFGKVKMKNSEPGNGNKNWEWRRREGNKKRFGELKMKLEKNVYKVIMKGWIIFVQIIAYRFSFDWKKFHAENKKQFKNSKTEGKIITQKIRSQCKENHRNKCKR